ncbi:MAG: hypothetical protein WA843_00750, partial [Candidatus Saccharimonadales bacterium]
GSTSTGEQPPLSENAPIVSMDIRLGKKYKLVDFDYDEFSQEANRLGLSEEDVAGTPISIEKKGLLNIRKGFYDMDGDKGIRVKASRKVNSVLVHEVKHKADDSKGLIEKGMSYRVGRAGLVVGNKLGVPTGVAAGIAAGAGSKTAEHFITGPYPIAMGALAVAAAGYVFHPPERRAKRAAKESTANIVTLVKK